MFHFWIIQANQQINTLLELFPLIGVVFIIALGVVLMNQHFQKNLYRQKLEKEELRNLQQKELLGASILAQENERKRIAQDIHDELGALLSISRMHLVNLETKELETDKIKPALENIRTLIEKSLTSMRRISHELMPPQLEDFGLIKTLEAVATHANNTDGISIKIETAEPFPELNWPVKLGLYRICMELINNTIKHTQADKIMIRLMHQNNHIELTYTDNGKGCIDLDQRKGLGQKNIEGRANSLGGNIMIEKKEQGFQAIVSIPLD